MKQGARTLILSVSVTVTSLVVGVVSYLSLQTEEASHLLILGSLPPRPVTYLVKNSHAQSKCAGAFDVSVDTGSSQTTVTTKGWMLVGVFGQSSPVKFEASLVFNALGQLSASFVGCTARDESMRFGTMGVNPITAQVFKGGDGTKPLYEYVFTGPIELRPRNGIYEIVAPQLPRVSAPLHDIALPISLEVGAKDSCSQENAQAIDLTPLLHTIATISNKVRGTLPTL